MDSGIPSLDGFVASGSNQAASQSQVSLIEANNQKDQQVRLARQERPSDAWRTISNYMPKGTIDFSVPKTMLLNQGATLLTTADSMVHGDSHQPGQMLNFPSLRAEVASFLSKDDGLAERTLPNYTSFPHYQSPPSAYARTGGYGGASLNAGMNGPSAFAKGPFTPSQRMELEYQVLIFKYLSANVPVPPELLTPLKKPLYPYPYGFSGGFYGPNSMGWGTLRHMGYMGSPVDPEPGRCRRTDGKKWRCSRDVVGDQKYCEST
ncbi:hypothetical protein GH714_015938 [Hevea brasiliensis]|uniref:Growth-regulating factor n=1 Tax=Hevea brasiliensis TaxID=3981 RepID=A0A6A6K5J4_HEVBR|nr:hypothetical protein GH714_015938 [Hevea brasiliensis]